MEDVTERGEIVQTTMTVLPTAARPEAIPPQMVSGPVRCEQAQRTKQQAQEQQIEKYR